MSVRRLLSINPDDTETRYKWKYPEGEEGEVLLPFPQKEERSVTVHRAEFVGLTKDEAAAQETTDANWKIETRERVDDSGQWRVIETKTEYGEWAEV